MRTETLRLYSDGLLSKWGFDDGDEPEGVWDAIDEAGIPYGSLDWHAVLRGLVRDYLLPVLEQDVVVYDIDTAHNPIRAESVDGVEVDHYADNEHIRLTPDYVEVPMAEVVAQCRAHLDLAP